MSAECAHCNRVGLVDIDCDQGGQLCLKALLGQVAHGALGRRLCEVGLLETEALADEQRARGHLTRVAADVLCVDCNGRSLQQQPLLLKRRGNVLDLHSMLLFWSSISSKQASTAGWRS